MAEAVHLPLLAQMDREFAQSGVALRPLDRADMEEMLPGLGPQWVEGRHEPSCRDMDVAAIHQGFLSMARRAGAELRCDAVRSEEHTSELQSLMRISYAVFCLKKKKHN